MTRAVGGQVRSGQVRSGVPANCIIIAPKRLKLRLSGSARKITKTVSRHADVQMSGRFGSNPAVLSRSVEKRGDQSRFKCRKMVNYYAIRSNAPLSSSCLPYCPWLLLRMDAIILESFRWDVDHMKGNTGKKTVFCFPMLYTENHHFAKTGSGQTWGKLHTTWTVFLFSCS
jgi:hypothetical protein